MNKIKLISILKWMLKVRFFLIVTIVSLLISFFFLDFRYRILISFFPILILYEFLILIFNFKLINKIIFLIQLILSPIIYFVFFDSGFLYGLIAFFGLILNLRLIYFFVLKLFTVRFDDFFEIGFINIKISPLYIHEMSDQIMEHIEKESN
jgi:hypothetical protein